ncbi:MAG: aminotransferase class I/II-fold pyridoxal phosphate-dependent enzyme [Candidatus Hydrogenedentes bacterium]|nr:aminotransferase class I/II-fold pyridoxal phosphate-dependent enzyme [Candidatus Hydrogenedentota bacterium]
MVRVSNRVKQMGVSAIHEMTRLSKEVDDVAFLSWAKPTADTPEYIKRAAIEAIDNGLVGGYSSPLGLPALRKEIVKKLTRDNNIYANESEILVTVGAIEGLAAAIMTVIDPGDEVIVPSPTYATHIRQVLLASGKPVLVPSNEENGFELNIEGIEQAVTDKTRVIMFATPANPTGTVFSEEQLRQVARIALKHNLMVITDEAYEYFVFDGKKHFSIASMPEMKMNAISCYTFTKTYAMTGWRIGYLHAAEQLIPEIQKAHIPLAICAPVVSQYAALGALQGAQDCITEFKLKYLAARDLMCERLDNLSEFLDYQKPYGSYLMFPRLLTAEGKKDSFSFCKKLLKEARVSTTPGIAFGPTGEGHLRMSFCVPPDMINKAFDRMDHFFKQEI